MTERPIIFSGPMVKAIIAGRKTMTRRILKPQPDPRTAEISISAGKWMGCGASVTGGTAQWDQWRPLRFCAGDRLWVRETFSGPYRMTGLKPRDWTGPFWYWADGDPEEGDWTRPKSSIHMPRVACRLALIVSEIKIERLQNISYEDCRDEGVICPIHGAVRHVSCSGLRRGFKALWTEINGAGAWEQNPFIVAIRFSLMD